MCIYPYIKMEVVRQCVCLSVRSCVMFSSNTPTSVKSSQNFTKPSEYVKFGLLSWFITFGVLYNFTSTPSTWKFVHNFDILGSFPLFFKFPRAPEVVGTMQKCEAYVDNLQANITNIVFLFSRFLSLSGAILNHSTKSKSISLGEWRERTQWPLKWVIFVESLRVFGIILTPDWAEIPDMNWGSQLSIGQKMLKGERAFVLDTFVKSKIMFRSQVIPMSDK